MCGVGRALPSCTQGEAPREHGPKSEEPRPSGPGTTWKEDMATDYDAPRKTEEEMKEDSIEELKTRRNDKNSGKVDEDEVEAAESFELPGADLSHEELTVRVLPRQSNEFTCASCFLVKSTSQMAETRKGQSYCVDCV